jgi:16S rRNA (adenine1518-N6/adenine1519-N6)-dimethyltransferase
MTRLGQHFLKDAEVLQRIVGALEIEPGDMIIEIGPGHGELTRRILERAPKKLIAIEKDKSLVSSIQYLVSNYDNLEVIEGDALKILPTLPKTYNLKPITYKVIGNIPYYITGKLLRAIGELTEKPKLVVLTIQKEVAERLCAKPPKMNLLAASVALWGEPEIIRLISRNAFRPRPKVESAVVRVTPHSKQPSQEESKRYYDFIKKLFRQPRKIIANNLAGKPSPTKEEAGKFLEKHGINPGLRPQNLDKDTINKLSHDFPKETL